MKLTKKHLQVFDIYEGKKNVLENVGTENEKGLFRNGEFDKIKELIKSEFSIKQKKLTTLEIQNHKNELNLLFESSWNKKSIKYLSKKYCEPEKQQSTFSTIMDILCGLFG